MKVSKVFYAAMIAGLSFLATAADLTFDLKINQGVAKDYNPENQKKNIAVFVIDCSGSMGVKRERYYYRLPGTKTPYKGPNGTDESWTRVKAVCKKVLPDQFKALPPGTEVYACLYSVFDDNKDWKIIKYRKLASQAIKDAFLKELQNDIETRVEQKGATPYFDAMTLVLEEIEKRWIDDKNVNLLLIDYTDGENATNGFYNRSFRYQGYEKSSDEHKRLVAARFNKSDAGKCLARIKADKKRMFYLSLNLDTTADRPGYSKIPEYKVNFYRKKSVLKNPVDVPSQTVPLSADFGVDDESWKLLRNDQCTLRVQFNDGKSEPYRVSLSESQKQIKVKIPEGATKVTVFFDCPKGKNDRFTLIPPGAPVIIKFPAADPSKTGIETVTVQDRIYDGKTVLTIRKGKRVFFTAEGSAKQYTWRFFKGKSMISQKKSGDGETVDCLFNEIGDYSFEVTADGSVGPNSKKTGRINVRDIGLSISNQGDKFTLPGTWEERIEATRGDKLEPSDLNWYVIGPFTGKEKEIPEMVAVDKQRNMFKCRHFFRAPGKYEITVTASYKELPGETFTAKTSWVVSQPAKISFSKSMEGDKHNYEFGDAVKLSIDVTGEIDDKTIVWKADGNEIGRGARKLDAPAVRGKGQITVVYTVEAMDAVLKKPVEPLKRTYIFFCSHKAPVREMVTKDGKPVVEIGQGDTVYFRVKSADKYENISWTFGGTEKKAPNGEPVPYVAEKAGKVAVTLNCNCKKCHTPFTKNFDVPIQSKDPKPRLQLKPEKASYEKGDAVVIYDAGSGYYQKCELRKLNPATGEFDIKVGDSKPKNFEEQICLGNQDFPVPTYGRADFTFKIVALGKDGKQVAESAPRTIRVRNPWISAGILFLVIMFFLFLILLMKRILFGNEPCGWTLYYMASPALVDVNDKEQKRVFATKLSYMSISIKDYWTKWKFEKGATIPAEDLFSGVVGSNDVLTIDSEGKIIYRGGFERISNYTLPVDDKTRQESPIFKPKNAKGKKNYLYLRLDRLESDTSFMKLFFFLCFFSLAVAGGIGYWLFFC